MHLRRWAFQDVLLVPAVETAAPAPQLTVSFACVLDQVDGLAEACRAAGARSVDGPRDTPWNTRDAEVVTPENARVVFTAAKVWDPTSPQARALHAVGIAPSDAGPGENAEHA